jgi:hypothetical protein
MNTPVQKIVLGLFAAIGSVLMIASAMGILWAWTTPDESLGFGFMFALLAAGLFILVFKLSMALLPEPGSERGAGNPTPISAGISGKT